MKDASDPKDRRQHPRADARLAAGVRASAGTELLSVTTLNVGAGGVYVEVPHFIEPLTKLELVLELPTATGSARVQTEAIVVRTQPDHADPQVSRYQIACAFLALSAADREALQQYVGALRTPAGA
jgi:c-di-GMP-binding flagellar brake protein YcgR